MRVSTALLLLLLLAGVASADEIDEQANLAASRQWLSDAAAPFASGEHEGLPMFSARIMEKLPLREEYLEREGWCSYYNCCAPAIVSTATSSLESGAGNDYAVSNVLDFDISTAWVEGAKGNGVGESISFEFHTHDTEYGEGELYQNQYVNGLEIITGYSKSQGLHAANACPVLLKVSLNGEPACVVDLQDSMDIQEVTFEPLFLGGEADPVITIEIISVRDGKKYTDAAISEISIRGGPCH